MSVSLPKSSKEVDGRHFNMTMKNSAEYAACIVSSVLDPDEEIRQEDTPRKLWSTEPDGYISIEASFWKECSMPRGQIDFIKMMVERLFISSGWVPREIRVTAKTRRGMSGYIWKFNLRRMTLQEWQEHVADELEEKD